METSTSKPNKFTKVCFYITSTVYGVNFSFGETSLSFSHIEPHLELCLPLETEIFDFKVGSLPYTVDLSKKFQGSIGPDQDKMFVFNMHYHPHSEEPTKIMVYMNFEKKKK